MTNRNRRWVQLLRRENSCLGHQRSGITIHYIVLFNSRSQGKNHEYPGILP